MPEDSTEAPTIADIRARKKPRRQEVDIPLDSQALAELADLQKALAKAEARDDMRNRGTKEAPPIRKQIEELEARIGDAFATFVFQQLPRAVYKELVDAHPPIEEGRRWNDETFPFDLIASSCVQPKLTVADVAEMFADPDECWGEKEFDLLYGAALLVNEADSRIPFGLRGSRPTPASAPS